MLRITSLALVCALATAQSYSNCPTCNTNTAVGTNTRQYDPSAAAGSSSSSSAVMPGYLPDYQGDKYTNQDRIKETQALNKAFLDSIGGAPPAPPLTPAQQDMANDYQWPKWAYPQPANSQNSFAQEPYPTQVQLLQSHNQEMPTMNDQMPPQDASSYGVTGYGNSYSGQGYSSTNGYSTSQYNPSSSAGGTNGYYSSSSPYSDPNARMFDSGNGYSNNYGTGTYGYGTGTTGVYNNQPMYNPSTGTNYNNGYSNAYGTSGTSYNNQPMYNPSTSGTNNNNGYTNTYGTSSYNDQALYNPSSSSSSSSFSNMCCPQRGASSSQYYDSQCCQQMYGSSSASNYYSSYRNCCSDMNTQYGSGYNTNGYGTGTSYNNQPLYNPSNTYSNTYSTTSRPYTTSYGRKKRQSRA